MKKLRILLPAILLAAIGSAGCFLLSGQFVITFNLPTPYTATMGTTLAGVDVDLNTISDYADHKNELKRIDDLALVGSFHNNDISPDTVNCWIVPSGAANLTYSQVQAQGTKLWGPVNLAVGETKQVDWNGSAQLFTGRQILINEIKGDGHFSLYVTDNSGSPVQPTTPPTTALAGFNVTITNGALIAVIGAGK